MQLSIFMSISVFIYLIIHIDACRSLLAAVRYPIGKNFNSSAIVECIYSPDHRSYLCLVSFLFCVTICGVSQHSVSFHLTVVVLTSTMSVTFFTLKVGGFDQFHVQCGQSL